MTSAGLGTPADAWPALRYGDWAATKKTFHMVAQMVGKVRLALAPPQPEWMNACLYLDSRGFTTGAMPHGDVVVTIGVDVFDCAIVIEVSDDRRETVALAPDRSVADIWRDFRATLDGLGIEVDMLEKPQELIDATTFWANTHDHTFEAEQARRFHRIVCAVDGAFEEFRSPFFGRTGIQFWWGSFDFCVLLLSGKLVTAPDDHGYIMRYDLDAEQMNAGFWPGDDSAPDPRFDAYLMPRPDGCEFAAVEPAPAAWAEAMGEWVLGGWDADAHRYAIPTRQEGHDADDARS